MGCRRCFIQAPVVRKPPPPPAPQLCPSLYLVIFFSFFLSGALLHLVEGDVTIPRVYLQYSLGRPLNSARLLRRGFGVECDWYCRPSISQHFGGVLIETHGDSLCRSVTVRYLLDQLIAAWRRDNHPFQTHVQYRGPLGGSALRGYQVSQADIHIPALPSPCLLCGRIAFPYLTRSGYDENVATTRLSWTASYREHTLRMTLRGFDTRGDETSHPTHHRCPCPLRRASGVVSFFFFCPVG